MFNGFVGLDSGSLPLLTFAWEVFCKHFFPSSIHEQKNVREARRID